MLASPSSNSSGVGHPKPTRMKRSSCWNRRRRGFAERPRHPPQAGPTHRRLAGDPGAEGRKTPLHMGRDVLVATERLTDDP